ncbi:MAG: DUF1573 domain-containing protein [Candidatus Aminicenantes bacterium]|jgi:uncharacterized cupredoxin-like copper-binding protein|nr:DUF1573 domain-containing protein [Candidatus Aminicenantes bacterium]
MSKGILKKLTANFYILLVGLLAFGWAPALAGKQPKIVFKEDTHDFGKVKQGNNLTHEFVFKNDGDDMLTIKNVETSCGCTAALVSNKKVEPGKTGKIKVSLDTRGYAGEVVKFVYVESDDPVQPKIQLKITAAINLPPQPRIDFDRFNIDAGLLVEGDSLEATVAVRNKGELELKFECALENAGFFINGKEAKFPVKVAAGKDVEVTVKVPLLDRIGTVREFVIFKTNDQIRSTLSVTLNAYIVTKDQLKQVFQKYKNILK